jgi:hypothetical protein
VDLIVTVSICLFLTTSAVGARVFTKALDLKHVQLEDCKNHLFVRVRTVLIVFRRNPGRSSRLSYIRWHPLRGRNYRTRNPRTPSRPSSHKRPRYLTCRCESFYQALDTAPNWPSFHQESKQAHVLDGASLIRRPHPSLHWYLHDASICLLAQREDLEAVSGWPMYLKIRVRCGIGSDQYHYGCYYSSPFPLRNFSVEYVNESQRRVGSGHRGWLHSLRDERRCDSLRLEAGKRQELHGSSAACEHLAPCRTHLSLLCRLLLDPPPTFPLHQWQARAEAHPPPTDAREMDRHQLNKF